MSHSGQRAKAGQAARGTVRDVPTVIVIGASLGGVEALRVLAAGLPADLPAAVCVVLHVGAHRSELPHLLRHAGALPASHAWDGEALRCGHIYVAPPDHHLTIEPGRMRLTKGPRENWARPAIDPLFRSAARAYGQAAIGVILTGALNDGTAGLYEIKERGGTTIVQDPADAVHPSMPRSALAHVAIDHRATLAALPRLLARLALERAGLSTQQPAIGTSEGQEMTAHYTHDQPIALTCPDCGGALRRSELGSLTQFRCHIGHVYTAEVMLDAQSASMERSLEGALRSLGEREELCRQMAEKARAADDPSALAHWEAAEGEARNQAMTLRKLLEKDADAA